MPEPDANLSYFSHPDTVLDYGRAAVRLGLWESERVILTKHVPKSACVLELGCGAGRVSAALARAGWIDLVATDFAPAMVEAARAVCETLGVTDRVRCAVADATALPFDDGVFDAAIFAFNGLQMIPKASRRETALREIARVLRPGGVFIFTGHDRSATRTEHWAEVKRRWARGERSADEDDFGDTVYGTPQGRVFIHSTEETEMAALLHRCGFTTVFSAMRSAIAAESAAVRAFSDDTRFRVCVRL